MLHLPTPTLPLSLCAALWLVLTPAAAHAQAPDAGDRGLGLPNRERVERAELDRLPTGDSAHQVLAGTFLGAFLANEESLGYSDLEPARVNLSGNSAQWTQWHLETLNITDPLFDGAEGFHVPWAMVSELEAVATESARTQLPGGISFGVGPVAGAPTAGASVAVVAGGAGGMFPLAIPLDAAVTGRHPTQRDVPSDPDRARMLGRLRLQAFDTGPAFGELTLRTAVDVGLERRHHTSYASGDPLANSQSYDAPGLRATALAELAPADRRWKGYLLAEYLERDDLFAELGFSQQETQTLHSGGVLAGLVTEHFRAGLTWKRYVTKAVDPDFARDLNDVDGEGRFPFVPSGMMNALRLDLGAAAAGFYVNGDLRMLGWSPDGPHSHRLTWLGAPAGSMTVESRATTTWIGDHRAGWARVFAVGHFELALDASLSLSHAQASGLSVALPGAGLKGDLVAKLSPYVEPFFAFAYAPVGITSQLGLAMTPGYVSATQRRADGALVQTFGGDDTRVASGLRSAASLALALGARSRFAGDWSASLQAIGKVWDAVPQLELDGGPGAYGHFTDGAYFFDGRPTRYVLTNVPAEQTPFGGAVQLQVSRRNDGRSFFTLGFAAMSFLGSPPPGNGAWANDVGVVDWSGASPNGKRNAFANLDADRAYVLRLSGGWRIWRALWAGLQVAFRDGQPFAFYDSAEENGQLASWQARPRGSPLKPDRPFLGWREDFQCVIDLQLSYDVRLDPTWSLRLKLIGANLFDLDNELNERQSPAPDGVNRSSLSTQLPRSVSFGVELLQAAAPSAFR